MDTGNPYAATVRQALIDQLGAAAASELWTSYRRTEDVRVRRIVNEALDRQARRGNDTEARLYRRERP